MSDGICLAADGSRSQASDLGRTAVLVEPGCCASLAPRGRTSCVPARLVVGHLQVLGHQVACRYPQSSSKFHAVTKKNRDLSKPNGMRL